MSNGPNDWEQCLQVSARSDLGLRRSNNQDSMIVALARDEDDWRQAGHLFVVADGMGAHAAGELASKLAVDQVGHLYRKHLDMSPPAAIIEAIKEANEEIHRRGQANLAFHNMGTTCSVLILLPQGALAAHVGDSRVYRLRKGQLQQLTFDHSLVWEMRQAGSQPDTDQVSIPKNVITRSLGPNANVKVDLEGPFPTEVDDTFLLCSDGLTGCVEDDEIASVLAAMTPDQATKLLVNLANMRGAPDNITIVVAKVMAVRITTRAARAEPLTIGESYDAPPSAPALAWIALGLLLLLAGVLWAVGNQFWATIVLACSALPGLWILVLEMGLTRNAGIRLSGGRRLGRAPYQKATAESSQLFCQQLKNNIQQAVDAAKQKDWEVDWAPIDQSIRESEGLMQRDAYQEALDELLKISQTLTEYCRQFIRAAAN